MIARLKSAGYTAGYGHALGISLSDSNNRGDTTLKRSCTVDLLSCKNCTVTLNDTIVKWADWPGTGSTNYNDPGTYNAASNGMQETGDSDDVCQLRSYYQRALVGTNTLYGYSLCSLTDDGKLQGFVLGKSKNTATFRIGAPIFYYGSNTDKASGSYTGDNTLYMQTSGIDLRYSTNCATTLTSNKPVYLVGIPNGSTYTLADTWWTQTLPSTDDGKIYIYLGVTYSSYQIAWEVVHPIYWYKNGALRLYDSNKDCYINTSGGDVDGRLIVNNTITDGKDLTIRRNTADNEAIKVYLDDSNTWFDYTNDETSSNIKFKLTNTDTESGGGAGANTNTVTITGDSTGSTISATKFSGKLVGTIDSSTTATTQSQGNNSTKVATTAYVDTAISNLPEPMIFKGSLGTGGTITSLPTAAASNEGFTYKVITAGTYASQAAKVGDTFISDGSAWILIPSGDEPSGTVTSITIKGSSPITVDSESAITTSGTRTISHANSGVTAGTYKSVTVNATGHVTAGTNPTTLSGYGITDAKIASGIITLGSNTITPLTADSTLNAAKLSGTVPSGCYTNTTYTDGTAGYAGSHGRIACGDLRFGRTDDRLYAAQT